MSFMISFMVQVILMAGDVVSKPIIRVTLTHRYRVQISVYMVNILEGHVIKINRGEPV